MDDLFQLIKDGLAAHWPFLVMSMILGTLGQIFKVRVWTLENAMKSRFVWWVRAFLPLHAPVIGALTGLAGWILLKGDVPASPGVDKIGWVVLYYAGAGIASAWVFNGVKHFAESRGLDIPDELDDDNSMRPKPLGPNDITPIDPPLKRPSRP